MACWTQFSLEVTMRPALALLLALSAATAAPLPFAKPPGKTDAEALQGEWAAVREPGVPPPGGAATTTTIRVKNGRIRFFVNGEMRTTWEFTLDPSKSKGMDLRLVDAKGGWIVT